MPIHVHGAGHLPAIVWGTAALLLAVLVSVAPGAAPEFRGQVVGVTDGDTITVLHDRRSEKIRLNGIDAPERGQPFGERAKQFTSRLAFGQEATVRVIDHDRYGRTIAEVILADGRSLNRELVRSGHAWWYRRYSMDPTLGVLEAEARAARRGLWSEPNATPPWEWRRANRRALGTSRWVVASANEWAAGPTDR
jgi:endonuclease YncB( thermonuclease family)